MNDPTKALAIVTARAVRARLDLTEFERAAIDKAIALADAPPTTDAIASDMDAALYHLARKSPFAAILHPDGGYTVSALAPPQFAIVSTPHRANAEAIAEVLNYWASGIPKPPKVTA